MKHIIVIHHADLDGYGAAAMLARHHETDRINFLEINYSYEDRTIGRVLDKYLSGESIVYFVDYCPTEDNFHKLSMRLKEAPIVIDHHKTNLTSPLIKLASVQINTHHKNGDLASGTSLVYERFIKDNKDSGACKEFSELVRLYDTWEWEVKGKKEAKELNDVLYAILKVQNVFHIIPRILSDRLNGDEFKLTDFEKTFIELKQKESEKYIENKSKNIFKFTLKGFKLALVYAERETNMLATKISSENKELDGVVIHDMSRDTFSFRSRDKKIDLSGIAKDLGGGGHPSACGFTSSSVRKTIMTERLIDVFLRGAGRADDN